ncbi:hypothetical protein ACBT36_004643 [Escherichia coli O19:H7]|nr:hypothetical protein [Escherichia coli]EFO6461681.1 hypothetical protein [Escherichia coli]EHS7485433.1 hypothetical protein [Escherichia coli]
MSAFKLLCDRLRNEATLAKSDGAGAFKKQSLDPDLKGGKKGKKPAGELEEDEAIASLHRKRMNDVKGCKTLTKSTGADDFGLPPLSSVVETVVETGGAAQTFAPIGAPVASPTEAVHRARAQSIQDAAFLNEMKAAGGQTDAFVRSDASLYALGLRFQRKRTRELVASDPDVAAAGEALEQRANGVNLSETFGGGDE